MVHRVPEPPKCPYCRSSAILLKSTEEIYSGRNYGPAWGCKCGTSYWRAYVGCHPGTYQPLGRLADAELRQAKMMAHAVFDPLWKRKIRRDGCSKSRARNEAYKWLAEQLGIPVKRCHMGKMSLEECRRVVEIFSAVGKTAQSSAAEAA